VRTVKILVSVEELSVSDLLWKAVEVIDQPTPTKWTMIQVDKSRSINDQDQRFKQVMDISKKSSNKITSLGIQL
jgi:hypothetical protein